MTIYLIILSLSGFGILFIVIKNFVKFQNIYDDREKITLLYHRSFFHEAEKYIAEPIKLFFKKSFIPFVYKKIEKIAHQARIKILKFENKILKFNNYIKGKRILKIGGEPSEYVKKINDGSGNKNANNSGNSKKKENGIQKMF